MREGGKAPGKARLAATTRPEGQGEREDVIQAPTEIISSARRRGSEMSPLKPQTKGVCMNYDRDGEGHGQSNKWDEPSEKAERDEIRDRVRRTVAKGSGSSPAYPLIMDNF